MKKIDTPIIAEPIEDAAIIPFAFFAVRHPAYLEDGRIDCEIQLREGDTWIPFTVSAIDVDTRGQLLWIELMDGKHGDIAPFTVTSDMLAAAKQNKHAEINAWRDTQENGSILFTLDGHQWDCGKASQARLSPVVTVAKAGMLPAGFFWTDADNIDVPMNGDTLVRLEALMVQNMVLQGFKIHERQRQMKEEVEMLTTLDSVNDYLVEW